jgi:hypothetical protein
MLDEVNVKTTFLTCAGIAERYSDAMKASSSADMRSRDTATIMKSRAI